MKTGEDETKEPGPLVKKTIHDKCSEKTGVYKEKKKVIKEKEDEYEQMSMQAENLKKKLGL